MEAFLSINHEKESPAECQIVFLAKEEDKIHRMAVLSFLSTRRVYYK